jgi:hypothetical protein
MIRTTSFLTVSALVLGAGSMASAATYQLSDPVDFSKANDASSNEKPASVDTTTGSLGGQSWVSEPANTTGGDKHAIYVQGAVDSQDPADATPSGDDPQLLFDSSSAQDPAVVNPTVGDITRMSWDTKRTPGSASNRHWFVNIYTKDSGEANEQGTPGSNDSGKWYEHNITFNLQDNTNYTDGSWNTLEANKSGSTVAGGSDNGDLEVGVYTQTDLENGGDLTSKAFWNWADDASKPDWWDEKILYVSIDTATGANTSSSNFVSNLDNFQFEFDTGSQSGSTTIDTVPEPTSLALLGLGAGSLLLRRRNA